MKRLIIFTALCIASAVGIVGCITGGGGGVVIEGKDNLTFSLDTLNLKPGQTAELTLVNNGTVDHNLTFPELSIVFQMPAGKTVKEKFTAPKAGEYRFLCNILGHFDTMKGKLLVKE